MCPLPPLVDQAAFTNPWKGIPHALPRPLQKPSNPVGDTIVTRFIFLWYPRLKPTG
jgi:hypothetical protein